MNKSPEQWIADLTDKFPRLDTCAADLQNAYALLAGCYRQGGKVLVCGNGGSAADSEHIVAELMKGYLSKRPVPSETRRKLLDAFPENGEELAAQLQGALPAISLVSQSALITAFANDVVPEMIFAQQVYGYGAPGDALVCLSTSGNSKNILAALQVARALGLRSLGLTGESGGAMKTLCDVIIRAPGASTPDVQEYHIAIYHTLCAMLEDEFFEAESPPAPLDKGGGR